jgi:hypothetical protein
MCVLLSYVYLFALLLCMLFHCSVLFSIVQLLSCRLVLLVLCLFFALYGCFLFFLFLVIVLYVCFIFSSSSYLVFVFFVLVYWTLPPGRNPIAVNNNNNNNNNNQESIGTILPLSLVACIAVEGLLYFYTKFGTYRRDV